MPKKLTLAVALSLACGTAAAAPIGYVLGNNGSTLYAFDEKNGESGVYTLADGSHRVAGDTSIEAVNEAFGTALPAQDFDTIGGLVAHEHGRVPRRGETVAVGGLAPQVITEALYWLACVRVPPFVPTEIRVITTTVGREQCELVQRWLVSYWSRLGTITFVPGHDEVIRPGRLHTEAG